MGPDPGIGIPLVQKKQQQSSEPVNATAHCTQIADVDGGMGFPDVFWAPVGATSFE